MDGFQITVQQVFDLDMNRVQSVTILKDAAAASIYGSRAANGVIVIETKVPEGGKLRFSYTFNGSIQVPDLTSYNLMNASELLEYFEKAQLFNNGNKGDNTSTNIYEDLVGEIRGVRTCTPCYLKKSRMVWIPIGCLSHFRHLFNIPIL